MLYDNINKWKLFDSEEFSSVGKNGCCIRNKDEDKYVPDSE